MAWNLVAYAGDEVVYTVSVDNLQQRKKMNRARNKNLLLS